MLAPFLLAGQISMSSRFVRSAPLPTVPAVMVDSRQDGVGFAQQTARRLGLQARIIWIDATANLDKYNTEPKIVALLKKIREVGFNTVVFDIKPISGQVVYASKIAPKLTEWRGQSLPADFDPLPIFVREAHADGLSLLVSLNAFSEGHRMFHVGPGYDKVDQQTVLYESVPILSTPSGHTYPLVPKLNQLADGQASIFTSLAGIPVGSGQIVVLDSYGAVVASIGATDDRTKFAIPADGVALYAGGDLSAKLWVDSPVGTKMAFDSQPLFVPIQERPEQQYPLMMDPSDPRVREYALSIVSEVVTNYGVDGVLYDDRLRFGGINADFSPASRLAFEKLVGHAISWPDDVFKWTYSSKLTRGIRPGPYYDQWMAFRASVIQGYVASVRSLVKKIRPGTLFGAYAGSWYGEYPQLGHNYASPTTETGFWFDTPNYQKQGTAGLFDFLIAGCYYRVPTIYDAMSRGASIGATVESAGELVNRLADDRCWTYAGLSLNDFHGNPDGLLACMQAACSATQGVMVFDLSHDIEPMWPVFAKAFASAKTAPHQVSGLLAQVRARRSAADRAGYRPPPVIISAGSAGTGQ